MKLRAVLGLVTGAAFVIAGAVGCREEIVHSRAVPNVVPPDPEDAGETEPEDAGASADARGDGGDGAVVDAGPPPPTCTKTFGSAITPAHGRLDGVVRAVIPVGDKACRSDDDHVIVQIDVTDGASVSTYPVWVNVQSSLFPADPAVRVAQRTGALVGPAWASGWHPGVALDYADDLGVSSSTGFTPRSKEEIASIVAAALPVGSKVSAYSYGFQTGDGAHKVHRNRTGGNFDDDGALVGLPASGAPRWVLFRFANQSF